MQSEAGKIFLTGHPTSTPATSGTGVTRVNAPPDTGVSPYGRLAVDPVLISGTRAGLAHVKAVRKGCAVRRRQRAGHGRQHRHHHWERLTQSVGQEAADGSGNSPSGNQVERAVGMAVHGKLRSNCIRQGGYRSSPVIHDAWWSA
ncbi:hypothetical protein [Streptomyces mirabilis]|uniref:hypothetical protein n=1 Tax=Streptomyces mirabilis TaxID=68239 RepID=UPI0036DD2811